MRAIRHTGIVVSDLDKAMYFYSDLFGLRVIKKMEESGEYLDKITGLRDAKITTIKMAAENGSLIELLYFYTHRRTSPIKKEFYKIGLSHLAFTVEDIDKEYERLTKAGVKFISPPQVSPDGYAKVAFCTDYDGNLIELVEVLTEK